MATTTFKLGGAAANTTVLTMAFTNVNNTLIEDDTVASSGAVTTKNAEAYIAISSFGFDALIPAGSVITQVNLKARATATTGALNHEATPYISAVAGTPLSANNVALTTVTSNAITRPGGGTWTRADLLNAVFTVRLRSLQPNNTTSRTYQWAWVEVEVVYTSPYSGVLQNFMSVKSTGQSGMSVTEHII